MIRILNKDQICWCVCEWMSDESDCVWERERKKNMKFSKSRFVPVVGLLIWIQQSM